MKNLHLKYQLAKILSVSLTGITNLLCLIGVLSVYANHGWGYLVIAGYLGLLMLDTWLIFWIWEHIINKEKK